MGRVGDVGVLPSGVPTPAVEGALDLFAHDAAAHAEVGTEVLTVGLGDDELARFGTVGDHVLTEVAHGFHCARFEFG